MMTLIWDKLNLDFQQHGIWEYWQALESLSGIKWEVKTINEIKSCLSFNVIFHLPVTIFPDPS